MGSKSETGRDLRGDGSNVEGYQGYIYALVKVFVPSLWEKISSGSPSGPHRVPISAQSSPSCKLQYISFPRGKEQKFLLKQKCSPDIPLHLNFNQLI